MFLLCVCVCVCGQYVWLVKRGKENKQKSWKISLATDANQDIYSCNSLFAKPKLGYSQLRYHIQAFTKAASYFPDEIAKCIFHQEKEVEYLVQVQFLIKQNQNVELYHVYHEYDFSQLAVTNLSFPENKKSIYVCILFQVAT